MGNHDLYGDALRREHLAGSRAATPRVYLFSQYAITTEGLYGSSSAAAAGGVIETFATHETANSSLRRVNVFVRGSYEQLDPHPDSTKAAATCAAVGVVWLRDRAAFAAKVAEESETSLTGQGLTLDTFQIQDVRTEGSYLDDLGRPEQARVQQEAAIAEARARQAAERERLLAEESIAAANRDLALKQATFQAETDAARAQALAAGPLSAAEQEQRVLTEKEKVAVRAAALKERELDTEVRKPADAARYRVEQEAEASRTATVAKADADRQARIATAQAASEESRLVGEGERAKRAALAEATRLEGDARAAATLATGSAEAETLQRKADAFASYNDAAVLSMLVEKLPELVRQASEPLSNIDTMTVIAADGTSALPRQVAGNVAQGLQILRDVVGVDVAELASNWVKNNASTATAPSKAITKKAAPAPDSSTYEK